MREVQKRVDADVIVEGTYDILHKLYRIFETSPHGKSRPGTTIINPAGEIDPWSNLIRRQKTRKDQSNRKLDPQRPYILSSAAGWAIEIPRDALAQEEFNLLQRQANALAVALPRHTLEPLEDLLAEAVKASIVAQATARKRKGLESYERAVARAESQTVHGDLNRLVHEDYVVASPRFAVSLPRELMNIEGCGLLQKAVQFLTTKDPQHSREIFALVIENTLRKIGLTKAVIQTLGLEVRELE